jgi:hypothetical protein
MKSEKISEIIDGAANKYGARYAGDVLHSPSGRALSLQFTGRGGKITAASADGIKMATMPATVAGVSKFFKDFYGWGAIRENPVNAKARAKLAKALALRAGFRSTAGTHKDKTPRVKTVKVRGVDGVQIGIGKVAAIEYTLVDEKGKPIRGQAFRHEFTGRSQPMLTASHDGKQLYFVGGSYRFKTDGINDI